MIVGERNGTLSLFERSSPCSGPCIPLHAMVQTGEALWSTISSASTGTAFCSHRDRRWPARFRSQRNGYCPGFWHRLKRLGCGVGRNESEVFGPRNGFRAASTFQDLNGDGLLDAVVGIQNGGILAYQGSTDTNSVEPWSGPSIKLGLAPHAQSRAG